MPLRILNLEGADLSPKARRRLAELGSVTDAHPMQDDLPSVIPPFNAVVSRFSHRLDATVVAAADNLRYIVSPTTGTDHIDLKAAAARRVEIICLKGQFEFLRGVSASAEHSWAILLGLIRRLPQAAKAPLAGSWVQAPYFGTELAGKRLGILGLGRIGEKVARYGQAFAMTVSAYDPSPQGRRDGVIMVKDMQSLLAGSDILSIHVPLDDHTIGLIGVAELALLPKGAILVNTARGPIVDEVALLAALRSGHLSGAALDVLSGEGGEGFPDRHPLVAFARENENLLITPHIGGATRESREMTELHVIERFANMLPAG